MEVLMSSKSKKSQKKEFKNVLPDLIIPFLALIFTVYYLTTITEAPWIAQASAIVVGSILILLILIFFIKTFFMVRKKKEIISLSKLNIDKTTTFKRLTLLILALFFTIFLEFLGFTLSAIIFLFFAIILLSSLKNWKNALIISLSCSLIGYFIFIYIFNTQFPRGAFENFIERIQDGK